MTITLIVKMTYKAEHIEHFANYYTQQGFEVTGCSRSSIDYELENSELG